MSHQAGDPAQPEISVSVVTYNSAGNLTGLIDSLQHQSGVSFELLVVDNASADTTIETLSRLAPNAHLIRNASNRGFGAAHNQNLARARGRCMVLLNPDVAFDDGLLKALSGYLDTHPDTAIVGPTLLHGPSQQPLRPAYEFPGEDLAPLPRDDASRIAWVSGSCFAIRTGIFRELGGFDEDYFLYAEEVDLCYRAIRAGQRIGYVPEPQVHHAGFGSQTEVSNLERELRLCRGREIFYRKHYPADVLPALHRAMLLGSFLKRTVLRLLLPLLGNGERSRNWRHTLVRLDAQIQVAREWLAERRLSPLAIDRQLLRMLARFALRSPGRCETKPSIEPTTLQNRAR